MCFFHGDWVISSHYISYPETRLTVRVSGLVFRVLGDNHVDVANMVMSIFENKTRTKQLKENEFNFCLTNPGFPLGVLLERHIFKILNLSRCNMTISIDFLLTDYIVKCMFELITTYMTQMTTYPA